jgi:hypothetical protein
MFHRLGINNSFLSDLRTSFIENSSMIKSEVVSIILPEWQNLLKEALLSLHIFNLSLTNMQEFTNVSISSSPQAYHSTQGLGFILQRCGKILWNGRFSPLITSFITNTSANSFSIQSVTWTCFVASNSKVRTIYPEYNQQLKEAVKVKSLTFLISFP